MQLNNQYDNNNIVKLVAIVYDNINIVKLVAQIANTIIIYLKYTLINEQLEELLNYFN